MRAAHDTIPGVKKDDAASITTLRNVHIHFSFTIRTRPRTGGQQVRIKSCLFQKEKGKKKKKRGLHEPYCRRGVVPPRLYTQRNIQFPYQNVPFKKRRLTKFLQTHMFAAQKCTVKICLYVSSKSRFQCKSTLFLGSVVVTERTFVRRLLRLLFAALVFLDSSKIGAALLRSRRRRGRGRVSKRTSF